MKKAISLFLALVVLVSVFAGLDITAYAVDTQTLWVDPVNGSDSAAGTCEAATRRASRAPALKAQVSSSCCTPIRYRPFQKQKPTIRMFPASWATAAV